MKSNGFGRSATSLKTRGILSIMSHFNNVSAAPEDVVFVTLRTYREDKDPKKVNLGIGAYQTEEQKPLVLECVKQAENDLMKADLDKGYLPIHGHADFLQKSCELLFGSDAPMDRICSIQTCGGTGAVRISIEFIAKLLNKNIVYLSDPTWANHIKIIRNTGIKSEHYRYWNPEKRCLNIDGFIKDLTDYPDESVILLHGVAHNPTGMDPSQEEWKKILSAIKKKNHLPIIDVAYQGFATGDCDKDAYAVRLFLNSGVEMFVCQSFSKSFGLYGERCGALHLVSNKKDVVFTQIKSLSRGIVSNCPIHGARIVSNILNDSRKKTLWKKEVKSMSDRIMKMRSLLSKEVQSILSKGGYKGSQSDWNHITKQIGMFSYTGLNPEQVDHVIKKWHVHMMRNGRISLAGVTMHNYNHIAQAFADAVINIK